MPEIKRLNLHIHASQRDLEAEAREVIGNTILEFARNTEHGPDDFITIEIEYTDKEGKTSPLNPVVLKHSAVQGTLSTVREMPKS